MHSISKKYPSPPSSASMRPEAADIQAVIEAALQKYEQGRKAYGQLDLSTDSRDFIVEAIAELEDCINYCVFQIIRLRGLQRP